MSGDEWVALGICFALALFTWGRWYAAIVSVTTMGGSRTERGPLALAPILGLFVLFGVLRTCAASDVRDAPIYLAFYTIMGAAWVGLGATCFDWLGISARDDAIERRNPAAAVAVFGALLGVTFCFAGANVGNGPGWWVVVFSGALATAGLAAVWAIAETGGALSDAITIDRDRGTALRLAFLLMAAGLVLGRAVAGDWVSAEQTAKDFLARGGPVLVLVGVELLVGQLYRSTRDTQPCSTLFAGLAPGLAYLAAAALYVWKLGPW